MNYGKIQHVSYKGGSRGVSMVSRNWSDHPWLVFACVSFIYASRIASYTFKCWKPVIKISRSALVVTVRNMQWSHSAVICNDDTVFGIDLHVLTVDLMHENT